MYYKSKILLKNYYKPKDVAKLLGLSTKTITNYFDNGMLNGIRTESNQRLIDSESLINYLNIKQLLIDDTKNNKHDVIYARVSTHKQKNSGDLDRQINHIKDFVIVNNPSNLLIKSEVSSGLNDNRKQLNQIIRLIQEDKVKRLFIMYKDRLTRFGFNYIKQICDFHDVEIIIVSNEENNKSLSEELAEDIIAIIHSFSGKLYGMRHKINKEINNIKERKE